MTRKGLVTQGAVRCLLIHKEHAIEIVESIIKETDLDPCDDQTTEDLGALGLFDFSRVCFSYTVFFRAICSLFYSDILTLGIGVYEVASR